MNGSSIFSPSIVVLLMALSVPAYAGSISLTVSGVTPDGTSVSAAVCDSVLEPGSCGIGQQKAASSSTLHFVFEGLAPGRYAVASYQDLNGNGNMDKTRLGLPLEPFGFSNDAGRSARPSFTAAAFVLGDGRKDVFIRLRGGIARQTTPAE